MLLLGACRERRGVMMSNDVIVKVEILDKKTMEKTERYYFCSLFIVIDGSLTIYQGIADLEGIKYPHGEYYAVSIVGKYDNEGAECEHFSKATARLAGKKR